MARKTDDKSKQEGAQKRPLCILGTAGTLGNAPYDIDLYEMWGCGPTQVHPECKRIDVLFEMHPQRYWGSVAVKNRLNDFNGPIYMQDHYDEIPNSVAYPREEVKREFYLPEAMYKDTLPVTNTITWMILKAIYDGYTDISLYGVHMAHETEYYSQQPSCSWALGIIHGYMKCGKISRLYIPEESELLKTRFEYGYEEPWHAIKYCQDRAKGMKQGIEQAKKQSNDLKEKILRTEGALMEADNMRKYLAGLK
jgi:hypothetical protein